MSGFLSGNSGNSGNSSGWGSSRAVSGTKEFFQSNSLVAKVAFLVLVVILFVILLRLGSTLITWMFSPSKNPKLVDGMKNAKLAKTIPADPSKDNSVPILRSNNERDGIEFTWSVWLYIDDLEYGRGRMRHIFHKGDAELTAENTNINSTSICPALYLDSNKNSLVLFMNTFGSMNEKVEIDDIPLNKWINVAIRLEGKIMDIYINGKVSKRHIFKSVPMQNYGDTYVNANGGYSGMISDLWYHNRALTGVEILNIVKAGPSLSAQDDIKVFPPYFSLKWYFQQKE
jgi:hypothetical protein